ncbi:hypothetical protein DFJ73DRAFT_883806, partial [Zopfochytrium polystomum]
GDLHSVKQAPRKTCLRRLPQATGRSTMRNKPDEKGVFLNIAFAFPVIWNQLNPFIWETAATFELPPGGTAGAAGAAGVAGAPWAAWAAGAVGATTTLGLFVAVAAGSTFPVALALTASTLKFVRFNSHWNKERIKDKKKGRTLLSTCDSEKADWADHHWCQGPLHRWWQSPRTPTQWQERSGTLQPQAEASHQNSCWLERGSSFQGHCKQMPQSMQLFGWSFSYKSTIGDGICKEDLNVRFGEIRNV